MCWSKRCLTKTNPTKLVGPFRSVTDRLIEAMNVGLQAQPFVLAKVSWSAEVSILSGMNVPSFNDTSGPQSRLGHRVHARLPTAGPYWSADQGRTQE